MAVDTYDSKLLNVSDNKFCHLTSREKKGLKFEMEVQKSLYKYGFQFSGNPTSLEEWKRTIGKGVDVKVFFRGLQFIVECKYLESTGYPSYVKRDYLPRYNGLKGVRIIVTNNKWRLTYNARKMLRDCRIYLLNIWELGYFIVKYANKHIRRVTNTFAKSSNPSNFSRSNFFDLEMNVSSSRESVFDCGLSSVDGVARAIA